MTGFEINSTSWENAPPKFRLSLRSIFEKLRQANILNMYTSKSTVGVTFLTLMSGYITSAGASLADFDPFTTPTGDGCVDPQGFRDCFQTNAETFVDCGGAGYCEDDQLRGMQSYEECLSYVCKPIQLQNNLLCWVKSCWNQVRCSISFAIYIIRVVGHEKQEEVVASFC